MAIRVLRPDPGRALGTERFLRESETVAKLTHPHILTPMETVYPLGRALASTEAGSEFS